jgi:hypothetical protein
MLRHDLVSRVAKAHDNAVKAGQLWSEAAAKGRKTETLYTRYENAEKRFDAAMAALINDGNRSR